VRRLIAGIEESGCAVSPGFEPGEQPMELALDGVSYRVFSWAITPGGRSRSEAEYRVQTTRPDDMPLLDPGRRSLLLGYHEELDVFAAWDARSHPNPKSSSSLQVPIALLRAAAAEGIASQARSGTERTEVVVAFQPAAIGTYLEMLPRLPGPEAGAAEMRASAKAGNGEQAPPEELPADAERRREIREIEVRVRDRRFRTRVVAAYGGRCAFCGLGAGLVEAAHIEGVGEGGPDLIANGLCACPTHHAAFDRGLLLVGEDHAIEVNEAGLRARGAEDGDLAGLRAGLLPSLALPPAAQNHPSAERLAAHRERWLGVHPAS
jgi:putative restriction endonuclease